MVQAAASGLAFAALVDGGGDNNFTLQSGIGCVEMVRHECVVTSATTHPPLAGWAQGYADFAATAYFARGDGRDVTRLLVYDEAVGAQPYEGYRILAAANLSALAVVFDSGGADVYNGTRESVAAANAAVALFTDVGGADTYFCVSPTCHGSSESAGRAVYLDCASTGDEFADGEDRTLPFTRGSVAFGMVTTECKAGGYQV